MGFNLGISDSYGISLRMSFPPSREEDSLRDPFHVCSSYALSNPAPTHSGRHSTSRTIGTSAHLFGRLRPVQLRSPAPERDPRLPEYVCTLPLRPTSLTAQSIDCSFHRRVPSRRSFASMISKQPHDYRWCSGRGHSGVAH